MAMAMLVAMAANAHRYAVATSQGPTTAAETDWPSCHMEIRIANTEVFPCREGDIDNDTQSVPFRFVVAEDTRAKLMGH